MREQIAIFRFRLSNSQTIGPASLKKLWSRACESNDVSVTRVASGFGYGERGYVYSLWAAPSLRDIMAIETQLLNLLQAVLPAATITLTQLR
jgi:hypothetical protein